MSQYNIDEIRKILLEDSTEDLHEEKLPSILTKVLDKMGGTFRNQGESDSITIEEIEHNADRKIFYVDVKDGSLPDIKDKLAKIRHLAIQSVKEKPVDKIKEVIMENTEKYIEQLNNNDYGYKQVAEILRTLVPQLVDKLAIKHFVGIQPMIDKIGTMFTMEYVTEELKLEMGGGFKNTIANDSMTRTSFEIKPNTIESGGRKFNTEMIIDQIESGFEKYDVTYIAKEIYNEVKHDILKIAHKEEIKINDNYSPTELISYMHRYANQIAQKTHRGSGNFIITSKFISKIIKSDLTTKDNCIFNMYGYINYVGTLAGGVDVYCDYNLEYNKVIIGYKGASEIDAGYFYCPFLPLLPSVVMNPNTFEPVVTFGTRSGKHSTTINDKCNYYYDLTFSGLDKAIPAEIKKGTLVETVPELKEELTNPHDAFDDAMKILD